MSGISGRYTFFGKALSGGSWYRPSSQSYYAVLSAQNARLRAGNAAVADISQSLFDTVLSTQTSLTVGINNITARAASQRLNIRI